jgi:predicted TPR repeat methyltransferase
MTRDWDLRADELSAEAIGDGEPTAWFDRLYAEGAAGQVSMPWDRDEPQVQLAEWAERAGLAGKGEIAVVVGCGLGADAEYLAGLGFRTTGFDVAPTAIEQARARHPGTQVDYRVANLLDLDADLVGAFDLVVEIFTLQALPDPPRTQAAAGVRSLVAPGGTLLAVAFREGETPAEQGPPFPLTRADMESLLATDGLTLVGLEETADQRWRAEYHRPR